MLKGMIRSGINFNRQLNIYFPDLTDGKITENRNDQLEIRAFFCGFKFTTVQPVWWGGMFNDLDQTVYVLSPLGSRRISDSLSDCEILL